MNQAQLEHVLRAAATIVDDPDILVIGSQAVLGSFADEDLPRSSTTSIEADLAFLDDPDGAEADCVDGAISDRRARSAVDDQEQHRHPELCRDDGGRPRPARPQATVVGARRPSDAFCAGPRILDASGGGTGASWFLPARRPHAVATTVAQGQWRARPPIAGHARARGGFTCH